MIKLYIPTLVLHVLVAVPGLGSIASIAIVTRTARRAGRGPAEALPGLGPLARCLALSLALMLATGILLDLLAKGAFHNFWWFRGSLLLLILAVLHDLDTVLPRVERLAFAVCTLIAAITVLMEVKPF